MSKKGRQLYVPPIIIEEMEDIMRQENLTVKAEALRKVGLYAQMGRNIKTDLDLNKGGRVIPTIPVGEKIRPKKINVKDVFQL